MRSFMLIIGLWLLVVAMAFGLLGSPVKTGLFAAIGLAFILFEVRPRARDDDEAKETRTPNDAAQDMLGDLATRIVARAEEAKRLLEEAALEKSA